MASSALTKRIGVMESTSAVRVSADVNVNLAMNHLMQKLAQIEPKSSRHILHASQIFIKIDMTFDLAR